MSTDLLTRIKKTLEGSSSQKPCPESTLMKLGDPEAVKSALGLLSASSLANSATITKAGEKNTVWWLTGIVSPWVRQSLGGLGANGQWPRAFATTTATTTKGENMETKEKFAGIGSATASIITGHPGIRFADLLVQIQNEFPEADANNLSQTLYALKKKKAIEMQGKGKGATYHPHKPAPESPEATPETPALRAGSVPMFGEKATALEPGAKQEEDNLSLMVDDDNHLHVGFQTDAFTLNPQQVLRLKRFLNRFLLESA